VKKLFSIFGIVLSLVILSPAVALADDPPAPPSTDVNVVVVTSDGVNLNVDISAGGNVNATVDGTNLNNAIGMIGLQICHLSDMIVLTQNNLKTLQTTEGIDIAAVQQSIGDMKQVVNLLSDATAKLIVTQGAMGQTIDNNNNTTLQSLVALQKGLNALNADIANLDSSLETEIGNNQSAFNTFVTDTKTNYQTLVDAVNNLSQQATDQKIKTDGLVRDLIVVGSVTVVSLIIAILGIVGKVRR